VVVAAATTNARRRFGVTMLILDFFRFIGSPAAITFLQGAERLRLEHTSCYDDKNWKIICTRDCHAASAGRRTKVFKLTINHGQLMSFLCFSKEGRGEKQEKH
jgi:hypothetical protein